MGRKYGLGKYGRGTYDLGGEIVIPPWIPINSQTDPWVPIPLPSDGWSPVVFGATEIWVPIPAIIVSGGP